VSELDPTSAPAVHTAVITISAWSDSADPMLRARVMVSVDGEPVHQGVVSGVEALCRSVCDIVKEQFPSSA
jgi:hypothetical protein